MLTFITVLIALVCVILMAAVLVQNPKGGGIDSTFGGAGANQMFGAAKSADFIEKATWILAAVLMLLCIIAAVMVNSMGASVTGPPLLTQ